MHVSEFLDRLYESPREWRLDAYGGITRGASPECPGLYVKRVTGAVLPPPAQSVWDAADNTPGHDPKIRRALLHACGLPVEG
jgi:hypothetical protein